MTAEQPRARVEARGNKVELAVGDQAVLMTPREAQRFAYWLTRAYCQAGDLQKSSAGGLMLVRPD